MQHWCDSLQVYHKMFLSETRMTFIKHGVFLYICECYQILNEGDYGKWQIIYQEINTFIW